MPDEAIVPPSLDDLEALAREAFEGIPPTLAHFAAAVEIRLQDFADDATLAALQIESPYDLLGLYRGVPLPDRTGGLVPDDQDRVFLYRRPILDYWCESGEDLYDIVRHVLIHEIGHHFGFSDADMERLEDEAE